MFYEIVIKVNRMQDHGKEKEVVERYITNCELFAEAEAKGMKECADYSLKGDVVAIKRSNVYEIANENHSGNDKLFKAKIISLFVDDNGKEKEQPYYVLLWASDMDDANKKMKEYMAQGMSDLVLKEIKETKILDILE
jgi:hypothetical protein